MNLNFLCIFLIICIIVIDLLTYKKDPENKKISDITLKNFMSISFTYLFMTFIFFSAFNTINFLLGIPFLILQIINIYDFYDNFIHSYRFYTCNSMLVNKILVLLIGLSTILFNEFVLSNIGTVPTGSFIINILMGIIVYSSYIFLPLLIIIRELYYRFRKKEEY